MRTDSAVVYGRMTRWLHWVSAFVLIAMVTAGVTMTRLPAGATQSRLYRLHVGLGLLLLGLTILRLGWRLLDPWPAPPSGLSAPRARAFEWNHILLYGVVVIALASGVGTLLQSGLVLFPAAVSPDLIQEVPSKKVHLIASRVFIVLLLMHLGGVTQYQLKKGDTFARMGIRLPGAKRREGG